MEDGFGVIRFFPEVCGGVSHFTDSPNDAFSKMVLTFFPIWPSDGSGGSHSSDSPDDEAMTESAAVEEPAPQFPADETDVGKCENGGMT